MTRREFIYYLSAAGFLGPSLLASCHSKNKIPPISFDTQSNIGHLLRYKPEIPSQCTSQSCDILIVGTGVAGLSAAYHLEQQNQDVSIRLLELNSFAGGNAYGGKNEVSAYPWAAHYVPIPGLHLQELISFFERCDVITQWENNLPVYQEDFLCFDNQERLYLHGQWQNGLIPDHGIPDKDKKEIQRFLDLVHALRTKKDEEGRFYFDIPLHRSSLQNELSPLTQQNALDWLHNNQFTSPYLLWYLDYCCADDFGGGLTHCSAWALCHYFASRKGQAANATQDDLLTWPEGNYYLVKKFLSFIKAPIDLHEVVLDVKKTESGYEVYHLHGLKKTWTKTICKHLVLNVPMHVCRKLIPELNTTENKTLFQSFPWVIANMTLRKPPEKNGTDLSWDNVQYGLQSLGFIHSSHQQLNGFPDKIVLTYYKSFHEEEDASSCRKKLQAKSVQQLRDEIISEMKSVYPAIEDYLEEIIIRPIGHGMITPAPGLLLSETLQSFKTGTKGLYFCHTDFCGMSLFEEAFYRGLETAKQISHA